jgi:hypothetical protein
MGRKLALIAGVIVAALLYRYALVEAFGYLPIYFLRPGLLHGARHLGGLTLLHATFVGLDVLIIGLVSLPFAILIARLYPERWLPVSVSVACLPAFESLLGIHTVWNEIAGSHLSWTWVNQFLSIFWIFTILPVLAYWSTSWRLTRTGADPCQ